ncbi:unnamed protein product, partial [Tilletia caries]
WCAPSRCKRLFDVTCVFRNGGEAILKSIQHMMARSAGVRPLPKSGGSTHVSWK